MINLKFIIVSLSIIIGGRMVFAQCSSESSDKQTLSESVSVKECFKQGSKCDVVGDYKNVIIWNLQAAEQGCAAAQYNLPYLYYNGLGVEQNRTLAIKLYQNRLRGDSYASDKLKEIGYRND